MLAVIIILYTNFRQLAQAARNDMRILESHSESVEKSTLRPAMGKDGRNVKIFAEYLPLSGLAKDG